MPAGGRGAPTAGIPAPSRRRWGAAPGGCPTVGGADDRGAQPAEGAAPRDAAEGRPGQGHQPAEGAAERRRRWGAGGPPPSREEDLEERGPDAELLVGSPAGCGAAAAAAAQQQRQLAEVGRLGARFAEDLFRFQGVAGLSYRSRGDLASLGETTQVQTTRRLRRDFESITGGCAVYWPGCACREEDLALFEALHTELAPWEASPYRRSRHPACVEEKKLLSSPTYRYVVQFLRELFGMRVGYSIVNLYADGADWTDFHRDNYRAEGNRMEAPGGEASAHNATVGASFGAPRELRFRHLETGLEFSFPQSNGDVFAFTEPVNSAFQHSVPECAPARSVGPRISVILWGRVDAESGLLPPEAKKRAP